MKATFESVDGALWRNPPEALCLPSALLNLCVHIQQVVCTHLLRTSEVPSSGLPCDQPEGFIFMSPPDALAALGADCLKGSAMNDQEALRQEDFLLDQWEQAELDFRHSVWNLLNDKFSPEMIALALASTLRLLAPAAFPKEARRAQFAESVNWMLANPIRVNDD